MKTLFRTVVLVLSTVSVACAATGEPVTVSAKGWSVIADGARGILVVSHDTLGILMMDVRLNVQETSGLRQLKNWSVEEKGEHQLLIRTAERRSAWLLDLAPNALKISCTLTHAVLTASVPASKDRVIARLLDPEGVPVIWVGTDEVARGYGGSETRNPSFLPIRNPECMYFGLGQVSGANFHSLFDRKTDTAIRFSDQTIMQRNRQNEDTLDATIPVPGNTLVRLFPDYYTKMLGVPFYVPLDDSHFPTAPVVWNSWTAYYSQVKEQDIVSNADWIADHLKPYGFEYMVLDEGYDGEAHAGKSIEVGENHLWIGQWDQAKFPHGPRWLANYIKSKGLKPGLWIVPNAYAGAVEQHPRWYLHDERGSLIPDYNTPALDSTNPEVLDFLKNLFTSLDEWGFEYYKFDGEHALPKYVPAVDKEMLYDKSVDPIVAYRHRLESIRKTIGSDRFIEGCPAGTPLNGIGYMDSYFNGEDLYDSWEGMLHLFTSINANGFLNHLAVYVMPGEGIDIEPPMTVEEAERRRNSAFASLARQAPLNRFGVTVPEVRTLVTYLSLTGVVYPVASVMPELPEERVRFLKMTLPTLPILPIDLFSRGADARLNTLKTMSSDELIHNYPEVLDLKVNATSGVYDVVGFTNWRSEKVTRTISLGDKLGLNAGSPYVVFDFWGQKLYGLFKDRMKVDIEPHDTRVFLIHPVLNRPQLVGISRHITGAYSIHDLAWDASKNRLIGSSETVSGESYAVFIYVPKGVAVAKVEARSEGNREVPVRHELDANMLKVTFRGQQHTVDWQVEFAGSHSQARSM